MKTAPLSPSFGLEIRDLKLQSLTDWGEFIALLHRWQVLVVRDQELSFAELVTINRHLGEPDPQFPVDFRLSDHPEIFVISNLTKDGKPIGSTSNGRDWHTDAIYAQHPNAFTMLYTVESPGSGGATLFASMFAAYDALPDEKKRSLEPLECVHSYYYAYSRRPNAPPMTERELRTLFPDVRHPLVRTHPATGRKGLFLGKTTTIGVEGPDGPLDRSIVDELIAYGTGPRFTYAHSARPGDFIIWDNVGLMHTATDYDFRGDRRLVYRMLTKGDAPR